MCQRQSRKIFVEYKHKSSKVHSTETKIVKNVVCDPDLFETGIDLERHNVPVPCTFNVNEQKPELPV